MTKKEFFKRITSGKEDMLQIFLDILETEEADYCVIGGLAVNCYAEPVVSLDLDIVLAAADADALLGAVEPLFSVRRFEHSINLSSPHSDLRIQIQTDERYQAFLLRARSKDVLGYRMKVASPEDVLQGKIWAYSDEKRRKSKRQKDLADIFRLIEVRPGLIALLPDPIKTKLE